MKDRFYMYHPVTNLLYFIMIIGTIMLATSPIIIVIGLVNGLVYLSIQKNIKYAFLLSLSLMCVVLAIAFVNPLYNHRGVTILYRLKNGNGITFEAIFFGFVSGLRLSAIIVWGICFSSVFTSDKYMYIFGKLIPATSLVISIALAFIPRLIRSFRENFATMKNIYDSKFKAFIKALSATITWSFESSVHSARAMRARGYTGDKRSVYHTYKMTRKDIIFIICTVIFICINIYGHFSKYLTYIYYPMRMYEKDGIIRNVFIWIFVIETFMITATSRINIRKEDTYEDTRS